MSGVIIPAAEGGLLAAQRFRQRLSVRCAACGEVIPDILLDANPERLEQHPVFVLCEQDYILIRTGYQRDRDLRARATFAAGRAAFGRD